MEDLFSPNPGPKPPADTGRQPRSMATGRFGRKSGEAQQYMGDLIAAHDSGSSILQSILRTRAPNAWRILEQLLR